MEKRTCGAKTRSGKPCKHPPMKGKNRCKLHGGMTPIGRASPHFKHGRYSKVLPADLAARYEQARNDQDLLSLRDEIALTDMRVNETINKMEFATAAANWTELQKKWAALLDSQRVLTAAQRSGDTLRIQGAQNTVQDVLRDLDQFITVNAENVKAWRDIENLTEQRRRLVQTEARRLNDMNQTITAERAMSLIYALIDIIQRRLSVYRDKKQVVDNKLLSGIATDIKNLSEIKTPTEAGND